MKAEEEARLKAEEEARRKAEEEARITREHAREFLKPPASPIKAGATYLAPGGQKLVEGLLESLEDFGIVFVALLI